MGEPIKKVNLDDILREKVEQSRFTYSEDNWNKLNIELTKQREKKAPLAGVILVLKNRWVQSSLVAAVAVFATYFYMTTVNATVTNENPVVQTAPVEDARKSNPEINNTAPPSNNNAVAEETTTNIDSDNNTMLADTKQNKKPGKNNEKEIAAKQQIINDKQNGITPVVKQQKDNKVAPIVPIEPMEMRQVELADNNNPMEYRREPEPILAPDTADRRPTDKFKVFALQGIGIKAGTSIAPTYEGAPNSTASGITVGLFSTFAVSPKLSLQAEVLYTQVKGHKIERVETKGETIYTDNGVSNYNFSGRYVQVQGMNYFKFPVLLKYQLSKKVSLGAGGYYSRLESPIGKEQEFIYDDVPVKSAAPNNGYTITSTSQPIDLPDDATANSAGDAPTQVTGLKQWDAGILLEAEFKIKRWSLGARFNQGVVDLTPNTLYNNLDQKTVYKTNTTTEITVGFLF